MVDKANAKDMAGKTLLVFEFPVERGKIMEFAKAVNDPNPVYRDRNHAKEQGFPDVLMPVTFPMSFVHHLPSQNIVFEAMNELKMNPAMSVHGGVEFIHERPVFAGETLRGELVAGDLYEKKSKSGKNLTFIELLTKFYDQQNQLVVTIKNVFIERG